MSCYVDFAGVGVGEGVAVVMFVVAVGGPMVAVAPATVAIIHVVVPASARSINKLTGVVGHVGPHNCCAYMCL